MACSCSNRADFNYGPGHYDYIGSAGGYSPSPNFSADPATNLAFWLEDLWATITHAFGFATPNNAGGLRAQDGSYYPPAKANIDHFN